MESARAEEATGAEQSALQQSVHELQAQLQVLTLTCYDNLFMVVLMSATSWSVS